MKPKERLIHTASNLFYTQGYNSTGINQILDEAQVSKGSLYKHFTSKEDLGLAYVQISSSNWFENLTNYINLFTNSKEKIIKCFDFLENHCIQNSFNGCRILNMLTEIDNRNNTIKKEILAHKVKLKIFFFELAFQFLPSKPEAKELGEIIYLVYEGAITESKVFKSTSSILTSKKIIQKILTTYEN
jgi:AcrR family transcriptional regulator